jgi:hypothetical protein
MILFSGNKKAYVGVEHGKKLSIPSKDAEKVKAIARTIWRNGLRVVVVTWARSSWH